MSVEASRRALGLDWLAPALLVALAATRWEPLAYPGLLILLCYLPGRYLMAALGVGQRWDRAGRLVLAVALSTCVLPVVLNPLWHWTNDGWRLLIAVGVLLTFGGLVAAILKARRQIVSDAGNAWPSFALRRTRVVLAILLAFVTIAVVGTYWPDEWGGVAVPAQIHDYIKHDAVLLSLQERPLPLGNPFFAPEADGPVYYYDFFYLIPATARAVVPQVSIALAFGVHAALLAISVMLMAYLLVRRITQSDAPATLAALLATVVGGLDIVALVILHKPMITLDGWADTLVRIHNLLTQMVWTPQNVMGLLILLLAAYLLSEKGWWRGWLLLGPVLGAALVGGTIWVAAAVMPAVALLVLFELRHVRTDVRTVAVRFGVAAVVAALMVAISLPTLWGYAEMSARHGKSLTFEWHYQLYAFLGRLSPPGVLSNLLDLPWVLAVEFGALLLFAAVLPRKVWRRSWDDPGVRLLVLGAAVALVGFVTVRSHFAYNDFGQKVILAAQGAGVVLSAMLIAPTVAPPRWWNPLGWTLWPEWSRGRRRAVAVLVAACLVLGLPVALFQTPLAMARRWLPMSGKLRSVVPANARLARQEAAAGQFVRHELDADAVIQTHWVTERLDLLQIGHRQIGVMPLERDTMVFLPRDTDAVQAAIDRLAAVLLHEAPAEQVAATLRDLGVTHVYVGEIERAAWVAPELFDDASCFQCVHEDDTVSIYAVLLP